MKKLIIVMLVVSQLFSCMDMKEAQIYISYIKSFERSSSLIEYDNIRLMNILNRFTNDLLYGRPLFVGPLYEKAQQIEKQSNSILDIINDINKQITNSRENYSSELIPYKNRKYNIPNNLLIELTNNIIQYRDTLVNVLSNMKDKYSDQILTNLILSLNSDIECIEEIEKTGSQSSLILLSYMAKIRNDILISENEILVFMNGWIPHSDKFLAPGPIIEPKASEIKTGEKFYSEIYFAIFDTTYNPDIYVGEKKLVVERGQGIYRKRVGNNLTGIVRDKGRITVPTSSYRDTINVPFEIEYEVVK